MATGWVALRCPRCGAYLGAPSPGAATSWVTCPHCYAPLPVVSVRDPPPLFSWEVYPNVYPTLPAPSAPGRHFPLVVRSTLIAAAVLLAVLAGVFGYTGASALAPGSFSLSGTVVGAGPNDTLLPVAGAVVALSGESAYRQTIVTGPDGTFDFTGVPAGGASLNVSAPGYAPVEVSVFFSHPYVAAGDAGGLVVALAPLPSAGSSVSESPFPNLESLLTSLWSGSVLFVIAALLAIAGAWAATRPGRAPVAVAGGASALVAPVALFLLGDATVVPWSAYTTVALSCLGVIAATFGAVPLLWEGPPPERPGPD